MKQSFAQTISLIKSDMQFRCAYEHKQLTLLKVLIFSANHAVISQTLYRFQTFFYLNRLGVIASLIEGLNSLIFTVRIDSDTHIGAGFLLLHANYINIGKNVKIGQNCILAHQNSISPAFANDTKFGGSAVGPIIGDGVLLGVGCALYGNITIGNNTKISANTAVDKSFPAHSVLFGVPARNFSLI